MIHLAWYKKTDEEDFILIGGPVKLENLSKEKDIVEIVEIDPEENVFIETYGDGKIRNIYKEEKENGEWREFQEIPESHYQYIHLPSFSDNVEKTDLKDVFNE